MTIPTMEEIKICLLKNKPLPKCIKVKGKRKPYLLLKLRINIK